MASEYYRYRFGFDVDLSEFQQAIQQAHRSLNEISSYRWEGLEMTQSAREAAQAAQELQNHLLAAVNVDTGKLDLGKFQQSLNSSGRSLQDYANTLKQIGPTGQEAFLQVAQAIAKADVPLARSSDLLNKLWTTMKNTMRWSLTSSALNSFVGALETAFGYAQDLNASLNNIRIVTGASVEDMKEYAKYANEAASRFSTTTTDYTDASLIYYQQGLDEEGVQSRTETTIKLANVTGDSVETVSEQLTAIWNNFYDGTESLESYADIIVALGAATASSSDEIAQGLQQFAAVADTVGLSYEYATTALATLTAETRQSENVVGTGLRTLFTRIQGLQLDEEQEDGTDLNKYSKALADVGIQIKDASGNLKNMDTILNEMGNTWDTLSQAQQVALAQTVGGVRQYAQLIALMDNWDTFQQNLLVAQTSEGDLNEQAKVYADSWEAAKQQVQNAAEDIYDSLINEDFFIEFDQNLAVFLHGFATAIDALGGFEGAITLVGYALTTAFGGKIAQSLRDLAYNFTVLTGQAFKTQLQLKEVAAQTALETIQTSPGRQHKSAQITEATIRIEDVEMQNWLAENARQMTEEQQKQLSGARELITLEKQYALECSQAAAQNKTDLATIIDRIKQQNISNNKVEEYVAQFHKLKKTLAELEINIPEVSSIANTGKSKSSINTFVQSFKGINTVSSSLSTLLAQLKASGQYTEGIDRVKASIKELTGLDLTSNTLDDSITILENKIKALDAEAQALYATLLQRGVDPELLASLSSLTTELGANTQSAIFGAESARAATEEWVASIYNATIKTQDWASTIVTVANQMSSLSMMMQGLRSLISVWNDEDMSLGDQLISTFTTLGMLAPQAISVIKLFNVTRGDGIAITLTEAEAQNLNNKEVQKNIVLRAAQKSGDINAAKAKVVSKTSVQGETVAVVANTTAWYANPVFWIAAAIMGVAAAIAILTQRQKEHTEQIRENATALKESQQALYNSTKEEIDEITSLYSEYIELRATLDESVEAKENLKKKTEELCKALGIEWDILEKISGEYENVNRDIANQTRLNLIQDVIPATQNAIEATANAMVINADDTALSSDFKTEFHWFATNSKGGGRLGNGDAFVMEAIQEALAEEGFSRYTQDNKNGDYVLSALGFGAVTDKGGIVDTTQYLQMYETISEVLTALGQDQNNQRLIMDSALYTAIDSWITEQADDYNKIIELRQDLQEYANELAQAEAAITNLDLASVKTIDEYNSYRGQYIENLKTIWADNDWLTDETDDEYFNNLADLYLSGYEHLYELMERNELLEKVKELAGEQNAETVEAILNNTNYDYNILATLDWEVIIGAEDFKKAFDEAYSAAEIEAIVSNFTVSIPITTDIISNLLEQQALEEEELALLDALEEKYAELGKIRDRYSASYIQALRDIREGMEKSVTKNALDKLEEAQAKLTSLATTRSKPSVDSEWIVPITANLDSKEFRDQMDAIRDAEYEVHVEVMADFGTNVDDIHTAISAYETALNAIQEGYTVSYKDIQTIQQAFPGILAGYTTTSEGMIQLNAEIAQSAIDTADVELQAAIISDKQQIQSYANVQLAKAEAMRTIAENLQSMHEKEIEGAEGTAQEVTNIDNARRAYEKALDEQRGLSIDDLAEQEIASAQDVIDETVIAAGTVANNWANAYDSAAKNSAEWAEIAITNAAAVADAMREAAEQGGDPAQYLNDVLSGAITGYFIGDHASIEYAPTYNKNNDTEGDSEPLNWEDYYVRGDYSSAALEAKKEAEGYEAAAAAAMALIAELDGMGSAMDYLKDAVPRLSEEDDKTGTGPQEPEILDDLDLTPLEDVLDRYHEITRELEDQQAILEDIDNEIDRAYGVDRLEKYQDKIEELEKEQQKYNALIVEASDYYDSDKAGLKALLADYGLDPEKLGFDEFGEIEQYRSLFEDEIYPKYLEESAKNQATIDAYNALQTAEEQEAMKAEVEAAQAAQEALDERFNAIQEYIDNLEEALDKMQEGKDGFEEAAREIGDTRLADITYKVDALIEFKDMKVAMRDLEKEFAESLGDALAHGTQTALLDYQNMMSEYVMLDDYVKEFRQLQELVDTYDAAEGTSLDIEAIKDRLIELHGNIIDSISAFYEWADTIENLIPDALDAAMERFEEFTSQLENNEMVIDSIKELYALQGITTKTYEGLDRLQKATSARLDTQLAQAKLQRQLYESIASNLEAAQKELDDFIAQNPYDYDEQIEYDTLKMRRDAYLEESQEAYDAMLSLAQESMESAKEMYVNEIEYLLAEFDSLLSDGEGLDFLQEKYDHYLDTESRYLDKVNEAYQVASWYNKLQADIEDTTNQLTKRKLEALYEEVNVRRANNTLSEYDLDILEAKYNILQAEIALEEAQNAKNELRMVRDRQGNWNFQYTADQGQIDQAQKDLINAENEYYNIAKDQVTEVTSEIIDAWVECRDELEEIFMDLGEGVITEAEAQRRVAEVQEYYAQKTKDLEQEKQIAIQDMTEAGNDTLLDLALMFGDEVTDLTGLTAADVKDIVSDTSTGIIDLITADSDTLYDLMQGNMSIVDLFENTYAEDLSSMTNKSLEFESILKDTLNRMEGSFSALQDTIEDVTMATGTDIDNLSYTVDKLAESTADLESAASNILEDLINEIIQVDKLAASYLDLAAAMQKVVDTDYSGITQEIYDTSNNLSGGLGDEQNAINYDPTIDYNALISQGLAQGLFTVGSAAYNALFNQRENKIKYSEAWDDELSGDNAQAYFQGVQNDPDSMSIYAQSQYTNADEIRRILEKMGIYLPSYGTGGYTGEFDNTRLALLHEKELVLNQEDTKNILAAVGAIRSIDTRLIESMLDGNAVAATALMGSRLYSTSVGTTATTLEQHVTIEHIEFPGVTDRDEIVSAMESIVNDAAQWALRRTE